LVAVACSAAPAVVLGVAYWADLSQLSSYVPLSVLAAACMFVFATTLGLIMAYLAVVALAKAARA
jgi:hypothetical protein